MFTKEEVADARFDNAILANCDLSGAQLPRANFSGALLLGTMFTGANLQGAVFFNELNDPVSDSLARLEVDWIDIRKRPQDYTLRYSFPSGPFFEGANLSGARFSGTLFSVVHSAENGRDTSIPIMFPDFRGANLKGADFTVSIYSEVRFLSKPTNNFKYPRVLEYVASYPIMKGRMALFEHQLVRKDINEEFHLPDSETQAFAGVLMRSPSFRYAHLPQDILNYLIRFPDTKPAQ